MIRGFIISAVLLAAFDVRAQEQGRVFNLQISEADLLVIGQALENMPYGRAAPVIARLQQQVSAALEAQKKATEKPNDKTKR